MHEAMENNQQAIMTDDTYTIPIVFHVMHVGEQEGSESNVSDNRIQQALEDLNNRFFSTGIQFCLATRDENGAATNGINRINAATIAGYANQGVVFNYNETEVKGLSRWTNIEYVNVWIVHNIFSPNPNFNTLGHGTFPGTHYSRDGIIIIDDIVGIDESININP